MKNTNLESKVIFTVLILWSCSVYGEVTNDLNVADAIKHAIELAEKIDGSKSEYEYQKIKILKDIAITQAAAGDRIGSKNLFAEAVSFVKNEKFYSWMEKFKEQGRVARPPHLQLPNDEERNRNIAIAKIDRLREIAVAQVKVGFKPEAKETFELGLELTNLIPNDFSSGGRAYVLTRIAAAQAESGEKEWAQNTIQKTLQAVESANLSPGDPLAFRIFIKMSLIGIQLQIGDRTAAASAIREANEIIPKIKDPKSRAFALRDLAMAQARFGDRQGAITTIKNMIETRQTIQEEDPSRIDMFNFNDVAHVAESSAESGHREDAEYIIDLDIRMMQSPRVQEEAKSPAWRIIGEVRARLDDVPGALEAEKQMTAAVYRGTLAPAIAEAKIRAGDFEGARQIANKEVHPDTLLKDIAIAQIKRGDVQGAQQTVESICCKTPGALISRAEAFRAIAAARIVKGERKSLFEWAEDKSSPEEKIYSYLGIADGMLLLRASNKID